MLVIYMSRGVLNYQCSRWYLKMPDGGDYILLVNISYNVWLWKYKECVLFYRSEILLENILLVCNGKSYISYHFRHNALKFHKML